MCESFRLTIVLRCLVSSSLIQSRVFHVSMPLVPSYPANPCALRAVVPHLTNHVLCLPDLCIENTLIFGLFGFIWK